MVESLRLLPLNRSNKAAPLKNGGRGALMYVLFEKLLRALIHLRRSAASPFWFERFSSAGDPRVALDRGETDVEEAGGRGLGHASFLEGSYDPSA